MKKQEIAELDIGRAVRTLQGRINLIDALRGDSDPLRAVLLIIQGIERELESHVNIDHLHNLNTILLLSSLDSANYQNELAVNFLASHQELVTLYAPQYAAALVVEPINLLSRFLGFISAGFACLSCLSSTGFDDKIIPIDGHRNDYLFRADPYQRDHDHDGAIS